MRSSNFLNLWRGLTALALLGFLSAPQAAETGLLWKITSPNGTISHVFGTIHVDDSRVTQFSPPLLKALEGSDVFMMETLPPSDPSLYFLKDYNLRDQLSDDLWEKARGLAEQHAMHEDTLLHMKPWLLAMLFDLPEPQSPLTQDVLLYAKAGELGKSVEGLEDPAAHFTMLDTLSRGEQLTILRTVLGHSEEEKKHDYEALLQAYLTGNADDIARIDEKATSSELPPALWQKIRTRLIDERNAVMAKRIAERAASSRLFVAVGAAHLAGKDGILGRLRKAGYKVAVAQ